jgi:flagellar motor switch protein FliN/FliY
METQKTDETGAGEIKNGREAKQPAVKEGEGPMRTKEIGNLDFILDIPLEVSVELGRAKMLISDLLQLGQGSVIELTKPAGDPLEIYVNEKLIARGEVVMVNDKFGIRMTDVISPAERVQQLGS